MSIKKKHMNWMMLCKLPLGASLWAILFFFIFTACQDDAPYEDTEVMVTFTTRAVVTDKVDSNAPDEDKMQDLRVIMLRQDGTVVDNHLEENINASSVTFTFSTPIQIDGEDFTFLAVANEESIQSTSELSWITSKSGDNLSSSLSAIQTQQIGNGVLNIKNGPIPQSKQWTVHVPQADTKIPTQRLDFVASKVSVEFKNETNKEQTLKNVRISGFGSATQAYLFKQNGTDFVGQQGVSDKYLLGDEGLIIPVGKSDSLKYYTYPVNTISTPTLHAQWKQGEEYKDCSLDLSGITSLPRNQQLKILITLTGQELVVNYTIAPWNTENSTNIGSPTIGGGYNTEDWTAGGDVNIGGDPVEPNPGGGSGGSGDYIWSIDNLSIAPNYGSAAIQQAFSSDQLNELVAGRYLGVLYDVAEQDNGRELFIKDFNSTENSSSGTLPSFKGNGNGNVFDISGQTEYVLTESDVNAIKNNGGGLAFWGNGFTITKIYVRNP